MAGQLALPDGDELEVSQMDKWEYQSVLCDGPGMTATLDEWGEQGWEAVGFAPVVNIPTGNIHDLYRPELIHVVTEWSASTYRILLKRRKP